MRISGAAGASQSNLAPPQHLPVFANLGFPQNILGGGDKHARAIASHRDAVSGCASRDELQFLTDFPCLSVDDQQTAITFHVKRSSVRRKRKVNRTPAKFRR